MNGVMAARASRTPQHHVVFRAVHLTRELTDALVRSGITIDMRFAEMRRRGVLLRNWI